MKRISEPGRYAGYSAAEYEGFATRSLYLIMPDEVKLAVNVSLPRGLRESDKIPAIVQQTRYWRAREGDEGPGKTAEFFLAHGYAWVDVDVRGTGASSGKWPYPSSPREVKDGSYVVNWIIKQPWSNGKVGTFGSRYMGRTAEFLLVTGHPALKAAAICCSPFDVYADLAFPGGIHQAWYTEAWTKLCRALDMNDPMAIQRLNGRESGASGQLTGVQPVEGDTNSAILEAYIKEHAENYDFHADCLKIQYRDDPVPSGFGTLDTISPFFYVKEIEASQAAVYIFEGWFDSAYVRGGINRYLTLTNPRKMIIGPWAHVSPRNISPWAKKDDPGFDHHAELLRFFDYHLKGIDNGIMAEPPIYYYTMGEEKWKTTNTWPLPSQKTKRFYFSEEHQLLPDQPKAEQGEDTYQVDYTTGTGHSSRWNALYNLYHLPIGYPDRAEADLRLLVYDTPPLDQDLEVTGHPVVNIYLSSSEIDASLFVYLEDLDPLGRVTYITEGLLAAVCRQISEEEPPYKMVGPYHSFKRKDMNPLVPNEIAEMSFDLLPTSVLFRAGHRIRVAIAGADKDHFATTAGTPPLLRIQRNKIYPSSIDLPVIPRK